MLFVNILTDSFYKDFSKIPKKDLVFFIVAYYPGLNCSQITKLLRKKFSLSITNQGVFKLLNELAEINVVEKTEFKYIVSEEWLHSTQKNIEIIKERELMLEKEPILI